MFVNKTNTLFVFKRSLRCDFCILNQFPSFNFNKNVNTLCICALSKPEPCPITMLFVYVDHYACKWPGQIMI